LLSSAVHTPVPSDGFLSIDAIHPFSSCTAPISSAVSPSLVGSPVMSACRISGSVTWKKKSKEKWKIARGVYGVRFRVQGLRCRV